MKKMIENRAQAGRDEIAQVAKQIWEREGRQSGRDLRYWLRAERELRAGRNRTNRAMAEPPAAGRTAREPASTSRVIRI